MSSFAASCYTYCPAVSIAFGTTACWSMAIASQTCHWRASCCMSRPPCRSAATTARAVQRRVRPHAHLRLLALRSSHGRLANLRARPSHSRTASAAMTRANQSNPSLPAMPPPWGGRSSSRSTMPNHLVGPLKASHCGLSQATSAYQDDCCSTPEGIGLCHDQPSSASISIELVP